VAEIRWQRTTAGRGVWRSGHAAGPSRDRPLRREGGGRGGRAPPRPVSVHPSAVLACLASRSECPAASCADPAGARAACAGPSWPIARHQPHIQSTGVPRPVTSARGPGRGVGEHRQLGRVGSLGTRPDHSAGDQHQQHRQHHHEPERDLSVHGRMAHRYLLACRASLLWPGHPGATGGDVPGARELYGVAAATPAWPGQTVRPSRPRHSDLGKSGDDSPVTPFVMDRIGAAYPKSRSAASRHPDPSPADPDTPRPVAPTCPAEDQDLTCSSAWFKRPVPGRRQRRA
jgi:hypothetical protein